MTEALSGYGLMLFSFDATGFGRASSLLAPAIRAAGLRPMRLARRGHASLVDSLEASLTQAALVLAYLHRGSPNVVFELGVASAMRCPLVVVCDDAALVPDFIGTPLPGSTDIATLAASLRQARPRWSEPPGLEARRYSP